MKLPKSTRAPTSDEIFDYVCNSFSTKQDFEAICKQVSRSIPSTYTSEQETRPVPNFWMRLCKIMSSTWGIGQQQKSLILSPLQKAKAESTSFLKDKIKAHSDKRAARDAAAAVEAASSSNTSRRKAADDDAGE